MSQLTAEQISFLTGRTLNCPEGRLQEIIASFSDERRIDNIAWVDLEELFGFFDSVLVYSQGWDVSEEAIRFKLEVLSWKEQIYGELKEEDFL